MFLLLLIISFWEYDDHCYSFHTSKKFNQFRFCFKTPFLVFIFLDYCKCKFVSDFLCGCLLQQFCDFSTESGVLQGFFSMSSSILFINKLFYILNTYSYSDNFIIFCCSSFFFYIIQPPDRNCKLDVTMFRVFNLWPRQRFWLWKLNFLLLNILNTQFLQLASHLNIPPIYFITFKKHKKTRSKKKFIAKVSPTPKF